MDLKRMKICHVSLALYPDHRDGSAKFAKGLYDIFKARGYNITAITAQWEDGFPDDPNIITIPVPKSRFFWVPKFFKEVRKYLKENDFDIIHGNGSRGSMPILFSGKPFITNIHDLGPFESRFTLIPGLRWLEKKNAKKAKRIITCSDIIRYGIRDRMGASLEKIHCVYSAIDSIYKPDPDGADKIRKKLGFAKGDPVMLYVGRIAFYKGVDYIIEAYEQVKNQIPNLRLVIGGKPTLKMESVVDNWKKKYLDVNFVGMIPDEEMPAYYTMADVFITYSWAAEGFGLTPIEALACGTPVIASIMPAYKEVLEEHALFVEPKRADLLAKTIQEFFNNKEKYMEKMPLAQEFIKRYTWDSVADRVEEVYKLFIEDIQKNE